MTIRTVIIDDEPPAREGIRLRLEREDDIEVIGEFGSAREAIPAIDDLKPDLLFLDVQMPGMSGIQMIQEIGPERVPAVILVTAYEEHALEAFEVSVVDYILKPIDSERFKTALDRARLRLERVEAVRLSGQIRSLIETVEPTASNDRADADASPAEGASYVTRFLVSEGDRERPLAVNEVDWIEAAGDYVRLHVGSDYHLIRDRMTHLEQILDPEFFGRIHRGTIVRLDRIVEIIPTHHGDGQVRLQDGTVLKVSRSYRDPLRKALGKAPD